MKQKVLFLFAGMAFLGGALLLGSSAIALLKHAWREPPWMTLGVLRNHAFVSIAQGCALLVGAIVTRLMLPKVQDEDARGARWVMILLFVLSAGALVQGVGGLATATSGSAHSVFTVPEPVVVVTIALSLVAGVFLIVTSVALYNGLKWAWWVLVTVLAVGACQAAADALSTAIGYMRWGDLWRESTKAGVAVGLLRALIWLRTQVDGSTGPTSEASSILKLR